MQRHASPIRQSVSKVDREANVTAPTSRQIHKRQRSVVAAVICINASGVGRVVPVLSYFVEHLGERPVVTSLVVASYNQQLS